MIDLTINGTAVSSLLFSNSVVDIRTTKTSVSTNTAYSSLARSTNKLIGARFLEIVATKVFGNAKATTAIENYASYYNTDYSPSNSQAITLIGQLTHGISNAIVNKKFDIFNEYILTDRLQDNANSNVKLVNNIYYWDFNFKDTVWEFPVTFYTNIAPSGTASMDELNNGPDAGGARLLSGEVSVPILLRFVS